MKSFIGIKKEGMKVVEDWHGREGINERFNKMISFIAAITDMALLSDTNTPLERINILKVSLETACQLGRQSMREEQE